MAQTAGSDLGVIETGSTAPTDLLEELSLSDKNYTAGQLDDDFLKVLKQHSDEVIAEALVDNERTSLDMVASRAAQTSTTSSEEDVVDLRDLRDSLTPLSQSSNRPYPIRPEFQDTTQDIYTNHFEVTLDKHT